ncbi:MAG: hypothetical protein HYS61_01100, partial [Acidobacteria bacterium]|nr:hypothetical protein [Acidobacteriota bacterium]
YKMLREQGRLKERHWMDYRPYGAVFEPKHMTRTELEKEIRTAWQLAYSPSNVLERVRRMRDRKSVHRAIFTFVTLTFRGIYFRQMKLRTWLRILWDYRRALAEVFAARQPIPVPKPARPNPLSLPESPAVP